MNKTLDYIKVAGAGYLINKDAEIKVGDIILSPSNEIMTCKGFSKGIGSTTLNWVEVKETTTKQQILNCEKVIACEHPHKTKRLYQFKLPDEIDKLLEPFILDNGDLYCHNTPFLIKKLKALQSLHKNKEIESVDILVNDDGTPIINDNLIQIVSIKKQ
jgi:hypothetical protein